MARFDADPGFSDLVGRIGLRGPGFFLRVGVVLLLLILAFNSYVIVGAGERGVVFNKFGGVEDRVLDEGLRFKIPFVQDVITLDVKTQISQTPASASSKDLQVVSSTIALNYHLDPDQANRVYQEVGTSYKQRIIDPAVQEAVKAVTARFTAEELITARSEVSVQIKDVLTERLMRRNVIVDEFSIVDFAFSELFNSAIEAKQAAEQSALKAQRDLERIKIEAEQKLTASRAEAEAQRLQRETISEEILQLRAIEKWDGKLPTVTSGAVPLIDLNSIAN